MQISSGNDERIWLQPQQAFTQSLRSVSGFRGVAGSVKYIWVVVKIRVPFWVPIIIRHLIFRVPKKGP